MEVLIRNMLDALDMFCYEYTPILIQFLKNWGALILAAASFAVSVVSLKRTSKAQDLQDRVNELELQIKQNEVARIEREKAEASLSCVEARVVKIGKGKYRMKVWNSGKATAFNVRAGFDGNPGIFIHDRDMQPFEELESGKGYELVLTVVDGSASKCRIITEWTDADGQKQSKSQMSEISA